MRKPTKRSAALAGAVLVALALALAVPRLVSSHGVSAAELKKADVARGATGTPKQRFAQLSQRHTNQCGLSGVDIGKIAVRGRLQGSCCNAMVYDHYVQQVNGLRAYAAVSEIPPTPTTSRSASRSDSAATATRSSSAPPSRRPISRRPRWPTSTGRVAATAGAGRRSRGRRSS